ncbi:MAG: hypothetical protein JXR68_07065 [Bacteroidales bacterium]|nr:hypothetical protein [Bacteroidales bacterium]
MVKRITLLSIILFIVSTIIILSSCEESISPELPKSSTFFIPDIENSTQTIKSVFTEKSGNSLIASSDIQEWTSIFASDLEVVALAYEKALSTSPKNVSEDRWVLNFEIIPDFTTYNVSFYATKNSDQTIFWDMQFSVDGDFQDFSWLTGSQTQDGNSGQWVIHKSPQNDTDYLQIDWTFNPADNSVIVKYTNIEADSDDMGGYIYYGNNQDGDFNAFYDIYNKRVDNLIEIDYNNDFHNGRIRDFQIFQDSVWHCWDQNFNDADCSVL